MSAHWRVLWKFCSVKRSGSSLPPNGGFAEDSYNWSIMSSIVGPSPDSALPRTILPMEVVTVSRYTSLVVSSFTTQLELTLEMSLWGFGWWANGDSSGELKCSSLCPRHSSQLGCFPCGYHGSEWMYHHVPSGILWSHLWYWWHFWGVSDARGISSRSSWNWWTTPFLLGEVYSPENFFICEGKVESYLSP